MSGYVDRKLKTYLATAKEKSGKSKEVCYICQNNHGLDKCQRRVYGTCDEKYPTGLHGYKVSKKNKDADVGNSQKSDSTLACATTKLKSKVVSMCVVPVKVKYSYSKRNSELTRCCIAAVREPSLAHTWSGS